MGETLNSSEPKSARALLVTWANEHDHWVRGIVGEILETRRALSEEGITRFYEAFLAEKELSPAPKQNVPPLVWDEGTTETAETLVLKALEAVEGVNALTKEQSILFNPRVTIVFGENGAGKTGYVRILKRVADVRTAEEILPNIRGATGTAAPRAVIKYALGGTDAAPLAWEGAKGVHPLTRLDVFDAGAVDLHVDEDLTYIYTPSDIALFRYAHDALEGVKGKLESARAARLPKSNPFLSGFNRDTDLFAKIESLGSATDTAELAKLASGSSEEETELPALRERVEALRSQTPETRATLLREDQKVVQRALAAAEIVAAVDPAAYEQTRSELLAATSRHTIASATAFQGIDIPGVLEEPWTAFVHAADRYRQSLGADTYPDPGAACIYCQQPLADAAVALVQKLRDFCDGALKKAAEDAQRNFDGESNALLGCDLVSVRSEIAARTAPEATTKTILELLDAAQRLQSVVRAKESAGAEFEAVASRLRGAKEALAVELKEIVRLLGDLTAQAEARGKALAGEQTKLRNVEARLHLRERLADIQTHVASAKWAERAQPFVKTRIPQLQKAITEVSKTASERLLNHDFESRFRVECEALKAPSVRLDFPGKKGQPARRKVLSGGHRLSAILSEGEQKALALADFLAEASLKGSSTPLVLDDPVTSLDYKRHLYVVDRLVALSRERQVIVFTHNTWFTTELLSRFEKETDRKHCSYYSVGSDGIGVISKGTHPRADTFSTMKGRLNALLQDAGKHQGETLEALVERGYSILRGICEVIVETDLLQGVVQRYQPNIRMTCLEQIATGAFASAAKTLSDVFERSCRIIEAHSQPLETLNVRPTLAELRTDWEAVEKARQSYMEAVKKGA